MARKILVLEDDSEVAELVQMTLEAAGHIAVTASNVSRAMTVLRNESDIQLAVVDIMMPMVDGYQFLAWLRGRPEHKDLPVIILTAHEERYGRERAEKYGVKHFLNKPFDPDVLKKAVAQVLLQLKD